MVTNKTKASTSTNPFDWSSDEESAFEIFHDARDSLTSPETINYAITNFQGGYKALQYEGDRIDFFSPLESALMFESFDEYDLQSAATSVQRERQNEIPLWVESSVTKKSHNIAAKKNHRKKAERLPPKYQQSRERANKILKNIPKSNNTFAQEQGSTPWIKLILLEELGTASSMAILLIPYIAFFVCQVLDSYAQILISSTGPLNSTLFCPTNENGITEIPSYPLSFGNSCSYKYSLDRYRGVEHIYSWHNREVMKFGWSFVSGPITDIPPISSFLRGGLQYQSLSTEVLAMVAQGRVAYSTVVMQLSSVKEWEPIYVSKPERLSMACTNNTKITSSNTTWNCVQPNILDVSFSLPGTMVLSGRGIQVMVFYSLQEPPTLRRRLLATRFTYDTDNERATYVFTENDEIASNILALHFENNSKRIETLVMSSSYTFEYQDPVYFKINVIIRLTTLITTSVALILWSRALGIKRYFTSSFEEISPEVNEEERPLKIDIPFTHFWWNSPFSVYPERIYLFALLICLILLQNPLLAYAYFFPNLYSYPLMHATADSIIGIGVFGILMTLHCLFHGIRYHTAEMSRRRVKQQREVLALQKAVNFLNREYSTMQVEESRHLAEYHERYGDVGGLSAIATRLRHDPFGDDWPDFLLPKLLVLTVGIITAILSSFYRFPNEIYLSQQELQHYNAMYIISYSSQLITAFLWTIMIIRQALRSGWMLRKEPFLSTRPAQLAFRVLFAILLLGLVALVFPFFIDFHFITRYWINDTDETTLNDLIVEEDFKQKSPTDILLQVLSKVSKMFPYSGTATSIGPGKIVYATICALVAAFIFLPVQADVEKEFMPNDDQAKSSILFTAFAMNHKRDKRAVVALARNTHTWRIFPLPIRNVSSTSAFLSNISFKIDESERSVAYFSKYTPVFCVELACWLLEASWQAYYSPEKYSLNNDTPGRMSLESIGLRLEKCIFDKNTDSQVYIATNIFPQVDGEEDSVIVVAFRGTANLKNISIDLKIKQVPLPDQIIGIDDLPMFQVSTDGVHMKDSGDWFWDSPYTREVVLKRFSPMKIKGCISFMGYKNNRRNENSVKATFNLGARAVLASTAVTRRTLPCVHEGFLEAYSHLRKDVFECVLEVLHRQLSKSLQRAKKSGGSLVLPKVYITGHSLGGSVGQLFALDLASNCEIELPNRKLLRVVDTSFSEDEDSFHRPFSPSQYSHDEASIEKEVFFSPFGDERSHRRTSNYATARSDQALKFQPPIALYSFGQPQVGNYAFSRLYKQRVPHTFRVVNEGDAFTSMPNSMVLGLGGRYKHAGLEVMCDEGCTGNIIVGPTVVETMFRFNKMRTSIAAHSMSRYRENLESGLTKHELHEYYQGHSMNISSTRNTKKHTLPEWVTEARRSDAV